MARSLGFGVLLVFVVTACSSHVRHEGSDGDVQADAEATFDANADASADGDADERADAEEEADAELSPPRDVGAVSLFHQNMPPPFGITNHAAVRLEHRPGGLRACGDTGETFGEGGACRLIALPPCPADCEPPLYCSWTADCGGECLALNDYVHLEAGVVTITGATSQPNVTCAPGDDLEYECDLDTSGEDWWETGDALAVAAEGGGFPAFDLAVVAPAPIEPITDAWSWTPEDFDGLADLTFEWVGAGADVFQLTLENGSGYRLSCSVEDDGRFDIPAAGITALGAAAVWWQFEVSRFSLAQDRRGLDGEISIMASPRSVYAVINAGP